MVKIFVGSAGEHRELLEGLLLTNRDAVAVRYVPWTRFGIVPPGSYVLDALVERLKELDGAAFLMLSTDQTWWRDEQADTPRDNVILEAGMGFALFGRKGTAIIADEDVTLPSDLEGLTTIRYRPTGDTDQDIAELRAHLDRHFRKITPRPRLLREVWGADKYNIIFHSFDNPEPGEFEEIVNVNAVQSIGLLNLYLSRGDVDIELYSSRIDELPVRSNLILLGSSASNRVTRDLIAQLESRLRFVCAFDETTRDSRFVDDRESEARWAPREAEGKLRTDYGIFSKLRNPYDEDKWIMVAAGNYGFGTAAAIEFSVKSELLQSVDVPLADEFQAVVEVDVFGRFTRGSPRLIRAVALPSP